MDDAWKVFNGFYVADWDENGNDVPEFTLDAGMGAGMGLNAFVVRADMTGGINAAASLDLLDEERLPVLPTVKFVAKKSQVVLITLSRYLNL